MMSTPTGTMKRLGIRGLASLAIVVLMGSCSEQPRPHTVPLDALPILAMTSACEARIGMHKIICRRIPVGWADRIDSYVNELVKQDWRVVSPGYGLSGMYEVAPGEFSRGEYVSEAVWFERPVDAHCSQRLSLNVIGVLLVPNGPRSDSPTANVDSVLEMLLIADYPQVCGAQQQLVSR